MSGSGLGSGLSIPDSQHCYTDNQNSLISVPDSHSLHADPDPAFFPHAYRRIRQDMAQTYKLVHGHDKAERIELFQHMQGG
jgi:hypothetical protein